jgi:ubiquitin carboxyl-terminal hydrolase MINDY-1/2
MSIRTFIDNTQSQLTYYGLFQLASTLPSNSLSALFRGSHLSVLYKASPDHSEEALFTLVTDQSFLHEPSVVWEKFEDVDGGGSTFVDSEFIRSSPAGGDYAGHTGESALAEIEAQAAQLAIVDPAE